MVEFAIVLPLLALLLVMAIDFGRVFFGWVALQNAARIAADFAARGAGGWPETRDVYRGLLIADMTASNCSPPAALDADGDGRWDPADVPDPTFQDVDGNGAVTDDGDYARVSLTCDFSVMTPLAGAIVGDPVSIGAEAFFAVNRILAPSLPTPEPTPPLPCPAPIASFSMQEDPQSGSSGTDGRGNTPLTIDFTSTSSADSSCPITEWEWTFGATAAPTTSTVEDPQNVVFVHPTGSGGPFTYTVELTVTTDDGLTDSFTLPVRVSP
jgi:TadE-like protein